MQPARPRLGQLLVDARILSNEELEQMLALQKSDGRRLGVLLVESGLVTETQLTQILSQQLSVPWVSLYHIDFSRELLNLVPREVAEKYCLVPIYVRAVRSQGDTLYVAMDDPMNEEALKECSQSAKLPARPMIASPTDIAKAIHLYYGASTAPGVAVAAKVENVPRNEGAEATRKADARAKVEAVQPAPLETSRQVDKAEKADRAPSKGEAPKIDVPVSSDAVAVAAAPARPSPLDDDGPTLEVHEIELPRGPKRQGGLSLTLLDGTQIRLPSAQKRAPSPAEPAPEGGKLTAADLLAALRAASHGVDAAEVLGENLRWEKMIAAILNLLLKKHLILEKELIDELSKI